MRMHENKKGWMIWAMALVLAAVVSWFVIAPVASSAETHYDTIASIDDKIDTVMKLTAGSTAASALISAMPGDTATPIADKLADYSTYFLLVLCALYLEKYLITITGVAAFRLLLPAAAILLAVSFFYKKEFTSRLAKKLAIFGLATFLLVPASTKASDLIYNTYAASIQETIENTENSELLPVDEETGGVAAWFIDRATNVTRSATEVLSRFVEALAVMIVTSCLIPILVVVFLVWLVKIILGIEVPVPGARHRNKAAAASAAGEAE